MFAGAIGGGGITDGANEFTSKTWPSTKEGKMKSAAQRSGAAKTKELRFFATLKSVEIKQYGNEGK